MKQIAWTILAAISSLAGAEESAPPSPEQATVTLSPEAQAQKEHLEILLRLVNNELMTLRCLLSMQTDEDDVIFCGKEMNKSEYLRGYRDQAAIGDLPPKEARRVRGKLNALYLHTKYSDRGKDRASLDHIARHLAFPDVIKLENGLPCEVYQSPLPQENGKATEADFYSIRHPGQDKPLHSRLTYQARRPEVLEKFPELFTEIDRILPQLPDGAAWRVLVPTKLLGEAFERLYSFEKPQVTEFTFWKNSISKQTKLAALERFSAHEWNHEPTKQGHPELADETSYMTGCADYIDAHWDTRGLWDIEEVLRQVDARWADSTLSGARNELLQRMHKLTYRREALLDYLHELDPATYLTDEEMQKRNEVKPIILKLK